MFHSIWNVWALIGAIFSVHFSVRIAVTVWDVYTRWRRSRAGDRDAWKHPNVDGPISTKNEKAADNE